MVDISLNKLNRLGQTLRRLNVLTEEKLQRVLDEQKITHKPLTAILLERGYATEELLAKVLGAQSKIPFTDDPAALARPEAVKLLPESLARKALAIPLYPSEKGWGVAMADPFNLVHIDDISYAANCRILPVIAPKSKILAAIAKHYGSVDTLSELIEGIEMDHVEVVGREATVDLEKILENDIDAPVVKLVNLLVLEAVRQHASDVHLDPTPDYMRVRFRVDGVLRDFMSPPKRMHAAVCSRIKVIASINIAERRAPQDGRALIRTRDGREVDLRVNIVPTIYGEKIGIRLLEQDASRLNIRNLGMDEDTLSRYMELIHRPSGMVLVVGPTGSGKTTALYSALKELNDTHRHIITIEDPVEYRLENINQIQVNARAGLSFAQGLRSILRQDPNVILVGEIRDRETAEVAVEAALTGHLVLSTAHSTDAAHTIARLVTLGVNAHLAASALSGIVSARLIRRLCERCRRPYKPSADVVKQLGRPVTGPLYEVVGCDHCRQTGYLGRIGIFELAPLDPSLQEIIQSDASVPRIQAALSKMNIQTLWKDGLAKVIAGETTVDELMRVTRDA